MDQSAVKNACAAVGGQVKLAALIKVSPQAVNLWVTKNKVPAERVLDVERASGISRHELRPDLYPVTSSDSHGLEDRRTGKAA